MKCKYCEKLLVYLGGTTNLRDHVAAKHPEKEIGLASEKDIPLLITASAVDPRYKRLKFLNNEQREIVKGKIIKDIKVVIEQIACSPPPAKRAKFILPSKIVTGKSIWDSSSDEGEDEDAPLASSSALFTAMRESEKFLKEPKLSSKECPLEWWKENVYVYPHLSIVARKYLSCPASSTPSERVFSIAGMTVTKKRASLSPNTVDSLIFLAANKL